MITKNSPADLCFELVQMEGEGDEANKEPRCFLARCATSPGVQEMTRCCRTREVLLCLCLSRCPDEMSGSRDVLARAAGELSPPITLPDDLESVTLFPCVWYPAHQAHRLSQAAVAPRKGQRGARRGGTRCPGSCRSFWGCRMFCWASLAVPPGPAVLLQVTQRLIKSSFPHVLS